MYCIQYKSESIEKINIIHTITTFNVATDIVGLQKNGIRIHFNYFNHTLTQLCKHVILYKLKSTHYL